MGTEKGPKGQKGDTGIAGEDEGYFEGYDTGYLDGSNDAGSGNCP